MLLIWFRSLWYRTELVHWFLWKFCFIIFMDILITRYILFESGRVLVNFGQKPFAFDLKVSFLTSAPLNISFSLLLSGDLIFEQTIRLFLLPHFVLKYFLSSTKPPHNQVYPCSLCFFSSPNRGYLGWLCRMQNLIVYLFNFLYFIVLLVYF